MLNLLIETLTGTAPYTKPLMVFFMSLQSSKMVRKNDSLSKAPYNWFLSLATVTLIAFGGGWFMGAILGRPASFITGADVNVPLCFAAYWLTFHCPGDYFDRLSSSLPFNVVTTAYAQLFRSTGMPGTIALVSTLSTPGPYSTVPLIAPILAGAMVSNVGLIYRNGYVKHFEGGVSWQFNNGWWTSAFLHLFISDPGILGATLRAAVMAVPYAGEVMEECEGDRTAFALSLVSAFFVVVGVLQMDEFWGAKWNPFTLFDGWLSWVLGLHGSNGRVGSGKVGKVGKVERVEKDEKKDEKRVEEEGEGKKKKKRNKGKGGVKMD